MPGVVDLAAFQLAPLSIVTSSTSELFSVLRIPHMYWSTSKPSNCAGLLKKPNASVRMQIDEKISRFISTMSFSAVFCYLFLSTFLFVYQLR